jgi:hypothetical protein
VAWAAAIATAFVVAQVSLAVRDAGARAIDMLVWPHEAADWLPHAAFLAVGIALFSTYAPTAWRNWSIVLSATLVIALPFRLLAYSTFVTHQWLIPEKLAIATLLGATFSLIWLLLGTVREDEHPRLRPALLIVVASAAALVIALSGVIIYGKLCGTIAAALSGMAGMLALIDPRAARGWWQASGAAGVLTVTLGGLIMLGSFYGKLTPMNAALLAVSLVAAGGRLPRLIAGLPAWQQGAVRIALCLLPLGVALLRALSAAQTGMSSGPYAA